MRNNNILSLKSKLVYLCSTAWFRAWCHWLVFYSQSFTSNVVFYPRFLLWRLIVLSWQAYVWSHFIKMMLCTHMQECKSIGADVNWGVRFNDMKDVSTLLHISYFYFCLRVLQNKTIKILTKKFFQCENFLTNLCKEVSLRLQGCGMQGRTFSLKVLITFSLIDFYFKIIQISTFCFGSWGAFHVLFYFLNCHLYYYRKCFL